MSNSDLIIILSSTVLTQQQSTETCDALDRLITNRNVESIGNCIRNTLCTSVICAIPNQEVVLNVVVTFLPCEGPISVRHRIVITPIGVGLDAIVIDQVSTGNQDLPFPSFLPLGASVMLSQTNTGVNYGVSSNFMSCLLPNACKNNGLDVCGQNYTVLLMDIVIFIVWR